MSLPPQNPDKNWLIFEDHIKQCSFENLPLLHSKKEYVIWSDRLVLIEDKHGAEFWNFMAFDLLMNEERKIHFRKTNKDLSDQINIYPLNEEFGFIVEKSDFDITRFFNFVKFNWDTNKFQLIESFEWRHVEIIVDKSQPEKFVIKWKNWDRDLYTYEICQLIEGEIEFGKVCDAEKSFLHYSNDKLIDIYDLYGHVNTDVGFYDLAEEKEKALEIDHSSLPKKCYLTHNYIWANDHVYSSFHGYQNTWKYGIVYANLTTKRWELLEFQTNLGIKQLNFFGDKLIMFSSDKNENWEMYSSEVKCYAVPMRRPNYLRYYSWLLVVQVMRNNGEKDPYEAAKEYLPLTSDLRASWFKDEEQK